MNRPDPHRALLRALAAAYPALVILGGRTEPWASVTFTGARHILTCRAGPDLSDIADRDFALPGHIVADIVARPGDELVIEALTIEVA